MTIEINYEQASNFLKKNDYDKFTIKKIAGDASFRSYYRITFDNQSLILMFAPPSHEDIKPFIKVDKFLRDNEFLAPEILAIDEQHGFLLLQDFGDVSYAKFLQKNPENEIKIYKMAVDELLKLHQINFKGYHNLVPQYNNFVLYREVQLFIDWYLKLYDKKITLDLKKKFKSLWFEQFDQLNDQNYFVLRDYHADNLMLVEEKKTRLLHKDIDDKSKNELATNLTSSLKVGLLDFQDALIGSRAYDLASLLEDARRDVSKKTVNEILDYYLQKSSHNQESLLTDYEILSLQRNIKILGIFARLALRDNKKQYLELLPRVLDHVKNRLNSKTHNFCELKDLFFKIF